MNNLLAIVIPTYNRSEILEENLPYLISQAQEFSIPIYISDNSIGDETKKLVDNLKSDFPYIFYEKNLTETGHDKNSLYVLRIPRTKYVWLLGDGLRVFESSLKLILDVIKKEKPGLISMNAVGRNLKYKSSLYKNCLDVFQNLGWHLTLTGATIYSRSAIESMKYEEIIKFDNFPQIPFMFNFLAKGNSMYWINEKLIKSSKKEGYWVKNAFSIFIGDLGKAINNLPAPYSEKIKNNVFAQHSRNTNLFGFKLLLELRCYGAYNFIIYKKYRKILKYHSPLNPVLLIAISIFPTFLLELLSKTRSYMDN